MIAFQIFAALFFVLPVSLIPKNVKYDFSCTLKIKFYASIIGVFGTLGRGEGARGIFLSKSYLQPSEKVFKFAPDQSTPSQKKITIEISTFNSSCLSVIHFIMWPILIWSLNG